MRKSKQDNLSHLDTLKAGSAMDCTGLIPADPKSQDEVESYQEMYGFRPEVDRSKKKS